MISTEQEYEYIPYEVTDSLTDWKSKPAYAVPCGKKFNKEWNTREKAIEHMKECRACKVVSGVSKAKVLYQDEVALTWALIGWDGRTSNGNTRVSYNGDTVMHYQTISHLRTGNGDILKNREDWSSGFANVTHLGGGLEKARLPLSTLRGMNVKLVTIEVLEQFSNDYRDQILFRAKHNYRGDDWAYYLFAWDEQWFIAELYDEPKTVKEAYESMKPELVKAFNESFSIVHRQGDIFFVPTGYKSEDFDKIDKAHYELDRWEEKRLNKPEIFLEPIGIDNYRLVEGVGHRYNGTRHFTNRLAVIGGQCYVQGNITHPQHRQLKLGYDTWFMVVQNRTKDNRSLGGGVD